MFYRVCLLLGPAPLVGVGVAAALWYGGPALRAPAARPAPAWAMPNPSSGSRWSTEGETPHELAPDAPLPPTAADGMPRGLRHGWEGTIYPVEVGDALNPNVLAHPVRGFGLEQTALDMDLLLAEAPGEGTFVMAGAAALVIRTAGTYVLTGRLERPAGTEAECLVRLMFGHRRVISNYSVRMVHDEARTYPLVRFALTPGLYRIGAMLGCWHGGRNVGPGRLTVLLGRPDEAAPTPLRPDELAAPEHRTGG